MSGRKSKTINNNIADDSKNRINAVLTDIIETTGREPQLDSYYTEKLKEIQSISDDYLTHVNKRFSKADPAEKDLLLHFLKKFTGVDHIVFLQDFVKKGEFLPRTGMLILELFNRSDAIIEDGIASALLDYDNFAQNVKQAVLSGTLDDQVIESFIAYNNKQHNALITQFLDELGPSLSDFISKITEADEKMGMLILKSISQMQHEHSYSVIEEVFKKTQHKDIRKLLKKAAHGLKQKGITVELPQKKKSKVSVFKTAHLPDARAFLSNIDAEGYRLLFMLKPVTTYENKIFNIILNETKGIHEIEVLTALRKEAKSFITKILSEEKTEFLEIDSDYASFLVEEGLAISREKGTIVSDNIKRWQNSFAENIGRIQRSPAYEVFSDFQLNSLSLEAALDILFKESDLSFCLLASDVIKNRWETIREAYVSPLELSEAQKQERIQAIQLEAATEFFTRDRFVLLKRRLEDLAFFMHSKGNAALAEAAYAVVQHVDEAAQSPAEHPFCRKMIQEGFARLKTTIQQYEQRYADAQAGR